MLYCTVYHWSEMCSMRNCTVLYCIILHLPVMKCTALLYCFTRLCTALLYCTILYCSVLYCIVLYFTVLLYSEHDTVHTAQYYYELLSSALIYIKLHVLNCTRLQNCTALYGTVLFSIENFMDVGI